MISEPAGIVPEIQSNERCEAPPNADRRYRLLVEGISDYAISLLSPTGTVTSWNKGAELIQGYTQKEIVGRHFSEFYSPEDRALGLPARALENGHPRGEV